MQGGAGGMMGGAVGGSGEDISARKIFVRGLSWWVVKHLNYCCGRIAT